MAEAEVRKTQEDVSSRPDPLRWTRPLLIKKALNATYFITAINQTAMFMYLSAMPYLFRQHGITPVYYGYIQSIHAFAQLIAGPFLGGIADTSGSRRILFLSMTSAISGLLLMGISGSASTLILSRAASVFMDILPGAMMTATDLVQPQQRGLVLRRVMVPMSLGMVVGPMVFAYLSKSFGTSMSLCLAGMVCLLSVNFIRGYIPSFPASLKSSHDGKQHATNRGGSLSWSNVKILLSNKQVAYLLLLRFLATLPGMLFLMNIAVAGIQVFNLTPQMNGVIFSSLGCIMMVNNGLVLGFLSQKYSSNSLLMFAVCLSAVTYYALSLVSNIWQIFVLLYPINLSYAIMENQIMTRLTKSVQPKHTSTILGLGTSVFHLSRTVAPSVGGLLMASYGWYTIGALGGATSTVMAVLVWVNLEDETKKEKEN